MSACDTWRFAMTTIWVLSLRAMSCRTINSEHAIFSFASQLNMCHINFKFTSMDLSFYSYSHSHPRQFTTHWCNHILSTKHACKMHSLKYLLLIFHWICIWYTIFLDDIFFRTTRVSVWFVFWYSNYQSWFSLHHCESRLSLIQWSSLFSSFTPLIGGTGTLCTFTVLDAFNVTSSSNSL